MRVNVMIAAFVAVIFQLILLANCEIREEEHKAKIVLDKILSSEKVSETLKKYFRRSKNVFEEKENIMIEFYGGNEKALRDFRIAEETGVIKSTATKGERISNLVERLEDNANISQNKIIKLLESEGVEFRVLWISNEIYVKEADIWLVDELASNFESVEVVRTVGKIKAPKPVETEKDFEDDEPITKADYPWHIKQINARCKDIPCSGGGVVVAILDTGVRPTHIELKDRYRSEYGWFDPVNHTEFPYDNMGHGTHVTALVVGKTVGVAPSAKYIGCKIFRIDADEEVYFKACAQWVICPHKWNNVKQKDCSKAPDIVNNSWNALPIEQFTFPTDFFYRVVAAWNTAGLISVFAAGNQGPYCTSVDPPAIYENAFSIGAVDKNSSIAWFSSRGPVLDVVRMGLLWPRRELIVGGENSWLEERTGSCKEHCVNSYGVGREVCTLTKPDVSAPGYKVNSANYKGDDLYIELSGTSMATPISSGVIALMVCTNNRYPGRLPLDWITAPHILKRTAKTSNLNLEMGNEVSGTVNFARSSHLLCDIAFDNNCRKYPNNVYGWGQVEACAAVKAVIDGKL